MSAKAVFGKVMVWGNSNDIKSCWVSKLKSV